MWKYITKTERQIILLSPLSDECAKDPFAPSAWQLVSYNPREEYISLHVQRDFKDDDMFWWEKLSNNNAKEEIHSVESCKQAKE